MTSKQVDTTVDGYDTNIVTRLGNLQCENMFDWGQSQESDPGVRVGV